MAVRVTGIRLSGGTLHEHIAHLGWSNPGTGATGISTRAEMVRYIEVEHGEAYVDGGGRRAEVGVVRPAYGEKYVRTHADGVWTDNLLALPRILQRGYPSECTSSLGSARHTGPR